MSETLLSWIAKEETARSVRVMRTSAKHEDHVPFDMSTILRTYGIECGTKAHGDTVMAESGDNRLRLSHAEQQGTFASSQSRRNRSTSIVSDSDSDSDSDDLGKDLELLVKMADRDTTHDRVSDTDQGTNPLGAPSDWSDKPNSFTSINRS